MNKTIALIIVLTIGLIAAVIYTLAKVVYPDKTAAAAHRVCSIDFADQNNKDRVLFIGPHQDPIWITTNLPELEDSLESLREVERKNADNSVTATVSHLDNGIVRKVKIKELPGPFPLVQPLETGKFIVVTASTFTPQNGYNAFIYNASGAVIKRLKFGPDINYVQVDEVGRIWADYDNLKEHQDSLNACGLVCFDQNNRVVSQYPNKTVTSEERIHYGQALNVVSSKKLYICPNRDSDMLEIADGVKPIGFKTKLQVTGTAVAFGNKTTLSDEFVMESRIVYRDLFTNKNILLDVQNTDGISIDPNQRDFSARGSRLYFTDKTSVYYLDAQELPQIK
jgi:hypothetical protein